MSVAGISPRRAASVREATSIRCSERRAHTASATMPMKAGAISATYAPRKPVNPEIVEVFQIAWATTAAR
jgi:hypothetical protein